MSATSNENIPNGLECKNIDNESKFANEDKQIQPKKCMPMNNFLKHAKIKKSVRRIIINLACCQTMMRMKREKRLDERK